MGVQHLATVIITTYTLEEECLLSKQTDFGRRNGGAFTNFTSKTMIMPWTILWLAQCYTTLFCEVVAKRYVWTFIVLPCFNIFVTSEGWYGFRKEWRLRPFYHRLIQPTTFLWRGTIPCWMQPYEKAHGRGKLSLHCCTQETRTCNFVLWCESPETNLTTTDHLL